MQQVCWFGGCDELEAHELFPNEFVVNTEYDEQDFTYVALNHGKSVIEYSATEEIYEIFTKREAAKLAKICEQTWDVMLAIFRAYIHMGMLDEQREFAREISVQYDVPFAAVIESMHFHLTAELSL